MTPINNPETIDPRERKQEDDEQQNVSTDHSPYDDVNEDAETEYMQEGDLDEQDQQPDSDEL